MNNIASMQGLRGRYSDAANSLVRALKLFDSLPPELLVERPLRESRGKTLDNLGGLYLMHGRFKEAEPPLRHGLAQRESLLAEAPDSAEYQVAVGLSKWHMGQLLKSQGAAAQARELLEQAVALEEQAVKADPGNQAAHDHLKGARNHLANCLTDLGGTPSPPASWRTCSALSPRPVTATP